MGHMLTLAFSLFVLMVYLPTLQAGTGSDWSYSGELGPDNWAEHYPDCEGMTQSPINIETSKALYNPTMQTFDLSDYSRTEGITMTLVNQGGHTAEVDFTGEKIRLQGGSLPDNYILAQFHFHWGAESGRGSEHALNGEHFPMELHLVHYQDHLTNLTFAQSHPSGLAVLGYFFKIGKHNDNFDQLLEHFPAIIESDQAKEITPFPVLELLPSSQVDFFRYDGSLTTPPCYESVIWSMSTSFIEIGEDQMAAFRNLHDAEKHALVDDYRPLQPLNHRTILVTRPEFSDLSAEDAASLVTASAAVMIVSLLLSLAVSY